MCKLCKPNPVSPSAVMDKVRLSNTCDYEKIREDDLDKLCKHISNCVYSNHDDGNFDEIYKKLDEENIFTISGLTTDNGVALVYDAFKQIEKMISKRNRANKKFKCY